MIYTNFNHPRNVSPKTDKSIVAPTEYDFDVRTNLMRFQAGLPISVRSNVPRMPLKDSFANGFEKLDKLENLEYQKKLQQQISKDKASLDEMRQKLNSDAEIKASQLHSLK